MRVRFGINYMPTGSPPEVVRWARLAEDLGYEILGISDSQSICRDVYMTLALCAVNISATQEDVVIADVDLSVIPELRALWGYYRDRRPDLYGPVVEGPVPAASGSRA
jgi:hypothetical protein